jgi:thiosulfate/3-mercaptopyruvate sulfurtransferase
MTGFVHPEYLVETDWLANHLSEVVVLDCTVHLIQRISPRRCVVSA